MTKPDLTLLKLNKLKNKKNLNKKPILTSSIGYVKIQLHLILIVVVIHVK
jgi:hypothetical protein